jgi:hypothetical protein
MADRLPETARGDPFRGCGPIAFAARKPACSGVVFEVHGTVKDFQGERSLAGQDECQFLYWAVSQARLTCDQEIYPVGRRQFERSHDPRSCARH